ncbi:MAG: 3-hydroxyacyl-CoA dehydrogenase, partial [Aquabacterium sp.]|nr:3-hydroxyacyl-CoA dehydrogenase [Aquabacterium sp.]
MESTAAAPVVQTTVSDHIALVTIANPPVNALSAAVRQGLQQAITALSGNADVHAIVITGSGANFIAGADIREFGLPPQ